jgi:DNA primase large subunit
MCMRNLHDRLRKDHHLKHMGRMQYGLFLKGIGLDLKDALTFWRQEFAKVMAADKFDKSYSYNIRHNYGKEGKRTDYTPYSCIKIILFPTGSTTGEAHGCPFIHHDREHLRENLRAQIPDPAGVQSIVDLVQNSHYQIACRRHWELTHPNAGHDQARELVINHPNQYFDESERYFEERAAAAGAASGEGGAEVAKKEPNFLEKAQEQSKARQDAKDAIMQDAENPAADPGRKYEPRGAAQAEGPAPKRIE